jgi:hypothetical protein
LRQLEREITDSKEERLKYFTTLNETESRLALVKEESEKHQLAVSLEKAATQRAHAEAVSVLTNKLNQENEIRLKLNKEMQSLLADQQRATNQWKEESRAMSKKYEQLVNELQNQLNQQRTAFEQLREKYARLEALKDDIQSQLSDKHNEETRILQQLKTSDSKNLIATRQIQELIKREHELIDEKKQLRKLFSLSVNSLMNVERQLDHATLDKRRYERDQKLSQQRDQLFSSINAKIVQDKLETAA